VPSESSTTFSPRWTPQTATPTVFTSTPDQAAHRFSGRVTRTAARLEGRTDRDNLATPIFRRADELLRPRLKSLQMLCVPKRHLGFSKSTTPAGTPFRPPSQQYPTQRGLSLLLLCAIHQRSHMHFLETGLPSRSCKPTLRYSYFSLWASRLSYLTPAALPLIALQ
jgi:hypothetical protein